MKFSEFFKDLYRSDPLYCYIMGGAIVVGILLMITTFIIMH